MRGGQCRERVAVATRLVAAGRLCQRRLADAGDERTQWCIDNWDALTAEVGAELGISRGRASSQMHHGLDLVEHFPALTAVFLSGAVDYRVISMILFRTGLITDPELQAEIDERLAASCPSWNGLSHNKLIEVIDWVVRDVNPAAVRVARQADEGRHVEMASTGDGMADLWGKLRATDAAVLDRRLDALVGSVCRDDPRTLRQRRADAVGALAAGAQALVCGCGNSECPNAANPAGPAAVVIHVVATAETLAAQSEIPAVLPGYGAIPAETVRDLAASACARVRSVIDPTKLGAEPGYRPSAALAEFVRCRDLTCRFPNCDRPAEVCDLDHAVPFPCGPTHPSNLRLLCRHHHLLKTFWSGPAGWSDRQFADGTIEWTSPTGRTYTTKPGGLLFFPQMVTTTDEIVVPSGPAPEQGRGFMMPTRQHTRKADHANRIRQERAINEAQLGIDPAHPPPRTPPF
ncbi:MAG: DUF222 domain-containing protein [Mycobacterium sp.]